MEVLEGRGEGVASGRDVSVVPAEEGEIEDAEEFECGVGFCLGLRDGISGIEPGARDGGTAERVAALHVEGVPVGDSEAELILKRLAEDDAIGVVPAVGKRIFG